MKPYDPKALSMRLEERWGDLFHRLTRSPYKTNPRRVPWLPIQGFYESPLRAYHTIDHVKRCLHAFDEMLSEGDHHVTFLPLSPEERDSIEAAIFLHDVIYDPRSKTNERDSANFASVIFASCCRYIDDIRRAILLTDHQHIPTNPIESIVCDVDLSSLAAHPAVFLQDCKDIRQEYSFVPAMGFWMGRSSIMSFFLARLEEDRLFYTTYFKRECNEQARKNLAHHLDVCKTNIAAGEDMTW